MFRRYVTDVTGNDKKLSRNERTLVIIYIYIIKSIDKERRLMKNEREN